MTDLLTNPVPFPASAHRSARDAYWTPPHLTHALMDSVLEIRGRIWEPCAGAGWMSDVLAERTQGRGHVTASDIDPQRHDICRHDFLSDSPWGLHAPQAPPSWIITNPPFVLAADILQRALSMTPRVALLVRLTFLEGTAQRLPILRQHPPHRIIILPRTQFPRGDGAQQQGVDSVPPCWLVWGVFPHPVQWTGHDQRTP